MTFFTLYISYGLNISLSGAVVHEKSFLKSPPPPIFTISIYFLLKKVVQVSFHNLEFPFQKADEYQVGEMWPSGSREEVKHVKSLPTNRRTYRRTDGRQTMGDLKSLFETLIQVS